MTTDDTPPKMIKRRKGIYLLPNLITSANLFAGFYAVIQTMNHHFETAALAIFIAMIADLFDGRVARFTQTQTEFGEQYDSLADLLSFGVAPAILIYSWSLSEMGKIGWLIAFLYCAATALRLARFNTQAKVQDKRYFQGLSSPAAAAVIAGFVWSNVELELTGHMMMIVSMLLTATTAFCMVSTVRYYSFKKIDFDGKVPFFWILIAVLILAGVAIDPAQVVFGVAFGYAISGPVITLWGHKKTYLERLKRRKSNTPTTPPTG